MSDGERATAVFCHATAGGDGGPGVRPGRHVGRDVVLSRDVLLSGEAVFGRGLLVGRRVRGRRHAVDVLGRARVVGVVGVVVDETLGLVDVALGSVRMLVAIGARDPGAVRVFGVVVAPVTVGVAVGVLGGLCAIDRVAAGVAGGVRFVEHAVGLSNVVAGRTRGVGGALLRERSL